MNRKKLFILLTVSIFVLAGCSKKSNNTSADAEVATEEMTESVAEVTAVIPTTEAVEMPMETEDTKQETEKEKETQKTKANGSKNVIIADDNRSEKKQSDSGNNVGNTEKSNSSATNQDKPASESNTKAEQPQPVSYSPHKVVELAVKKTKALGKVYIPDDLDRLLKAGDISQEEYNEYYPTDGAGYLEYFVAMDMNEARDVSGTKSFQSESDIAADIAGMYSALPQETFYIEFHGTMNYAGKECYVFYC